MLRYFSFQIKRIAFQIHPDIRFTFDGFQTIKSSRQLFSWRLLLSEKQDIGIPS